jgi:hypothetical protein
VIEGKRDGRIEMRGRRRTNLLGDFKGTRGYGKLREEALDRTVWRTRFGTGYGPVVRQSAEGVNETNYMPKARCTLQFKNTILCNNI